MDHVTGYSWDRPKATASEALAELDGAVLAARLAKECASARDAIDSARASGDERGYVTALQALVDCAERAGDFAVAERAAADAVGSAEASGDSRLTGAATLLEGAILLRAGQMSRAVVSLKQALKWSENANDATLTSLALTQLAINAGASGDREDALRSLDHAFAIGRSGGISLAKGHALATVACLEIVAAPPSAGDGSETPDLGMFNVLGRAQLLHERVGDVSALGRTYNNFGVLHYIRGRFVSAIPFFERSLELLGGTSDILALLAVLNNNIRAAEQYYLDRAGSLRDKMEEFAAVLRDQDLPRFADRTAWPAKALHQQSPAETFASDLFVADLMLLPPTLLTWHIAAGGI